MGVWTFETGMLYQSEPKYWLVLGFCCLSWQKIVLIFDLLIGGNCESGTITRW